MYSFEFIKQWQTQDETRSKEKVQNHQAKPQGIIPSYYSTIIGVGAYITDLITFGS